MSLYPLSLEAVPVGAPAVWWTNYSQQVDREPWGDSIGCLATSTNVWDYERKRALTGLELLALHGYPVSEFAEGTAEIPQVGDKDFSRLAGNGVSLPVLGSVMLSFILNSSAPWWRRHTPELGAQSSASEPKRRRIDGGQP